MKELHYFFAFIILSSFTTLLFSFSNPRHYFSEKQKKIIENLSLGSIIIFSSIESFLIYKTHFSKEDLEISPQNTLRDTFLEQGEVLAQSIERQSEDTIVINNDNIPTQILIDQPNSLTENERTAISRESSTSFSIEMPQNVQENKTSQHNSPQRKLTNSKAISRCGSSSSANTIYSTQNANSSPCLEHIQNQLTKPILAHEKQICTFFKKPRDDFF